MLSDAFAYYLEVAIEQKKPVNYFDELPRYQIVDAELEEGAFIMVMGEKLQKRIDLQEVLVKRSNSVPHEFYIEKKSNSSDYGVIIFEQM